MYQYVKIMCFSNQHFKDFISENLIRVKHHWLEHSHYATIIMPINDWDEITEKVNYDDEEAVEEFYSFGEVVFFECDKEII